MDAWMTSSATRSGCGRPTASTCTSFGRLDVAPLYRYNSAAPYSLVAGGRCADSAADRAQSRLCAAAGQPAGVLRRARLAGVRRLRGCSTSAVTYGVPVWQSLRPWVKLEVLNMFNNQKLISWDTTVAADAAGPEDALRASARLHHRTELRPGHVERQLRAAASGHGRRPHVPAGRRGEILRKKEGRRKKDATQVASLSAGCCSPASCAGACSGGGRSL